MFLNCSNHNSKNWNQEQRQEAEKWGEIVDYTFPSVNANADEEEVSALAERTAKEIIAMEPERVMCQGEFTLTYLLVKLLKEHGIVVLAACSERKTVEKKLPDGEIEKTSVFEFRRFRKY